MKTQSMCPLSAGDFPNRILQPMTKPDRSYIPHLTIQEVSIAPGGEWSQRMSGWTLIFISSGLGYWMGERANKELDAGAAFLLSCQSRGTIRSSQIGGLQLQFFSVEPARLTGVITLGEQRFFDSAASKPEFSIRVFAPDNSIAANMRELIANRGRNGSWLRLQLLRLFIEAFGDDLKMEPTKQPPQLQAKERLEEFLRKTPTSELLCMSLAELAQITRCTPRHLNRIFNEVVGMSFREKHTELRLARACELLATTESKIVDIALESGYQSLSLFNLMFTRRFGVSPGKWRDLRRGNKAEPSARSRVKAIQLLPRTGPQPAVLHPIAARPVMFG